MVQKRGLGRGLGALIPGAETPQGTAQEIGLDQIEANPYQPRHRFGGAALDELASTIKAHGVLTPIVVRRGPTGFQIIAGERRVRAARLAGLTAVPAIVKEASDGQALEMALVENLQREDLNPLESAEAYQRLIEEFGLTQEEIANRLGRDRSSIANALRLLRLPLRIRDDIAAGTLSEGHARALLGLEKPADQLKARDLVVKKGLSVREAEALVRRWRGNGTVRPARAAGQDPNLAALEDQLRSTLGTKVRIVREGVGGTIQVSYFSADELTRIIEAIVGTR
ncbi:MAG TPA: ParB/RepB/Spo0J family partition protein [Candidatus Baltobacteraceae bacterium]|nr:ParB/RepB/Spo0J family partition protein [Candidatus Baltobacteraceae bacterium]